MATEANTILGLSDGIDLTDYYLERRSCEGFVYVHKKYKNNSDLKLTRSMKDLHKTKKNKDKLKKKKRKDTEEKGQQFNCDVDTDGFRYNKTFKVALSDDSIPEETVRFARNIAPLLLPPNREGELAVCPIFYTVISNRKSKKKIHKTKDDSEQVDVKPEKSKKVVEMFINDKIAESFSVKESVSTANNTIDVQPSLCCSLSDISDKKPVRKERDYKSKSDVIRFVTSESLEALANDLGNQSGDAKIKLQLLNDTDKSLICDNIRGPVITAIRETVDINQLNNKELNSALMNVHNLLKCNTQKLDLVLERITCLDKQLEIFRETKINSPKKMKSSPLETLSEDLIEVQENSSEEECYQEDLDRRKVRTKTEAVQIIGLEEKNTSKAVISPGKGEEISRTKNLGNAETQLGHKPDRPGRLPARFCWTDAARKSTT